MDKETEILHCMIMNNSTIATGKNGFYFKMYRLNDEFKENLSMYDPLVKMEMFYLDFSKFFRDGVVLNGDDSLQVSLDRNQFREIIPFIEEAIVGEGLTVSKFVPSEDHVKTIFDKENLLRKMVQ